VLELSPEVIDRALAGDERLIRRIVDTLTPTIQARVAKALWRRRTAAGNRDVAQEVEDLTQAVFLSFFADDGRVLRTWDPARGGLDTFVRVVAEREVSSILRTRSRNPWTEEPTGADQLERQVSVGADIEAVLGSHELLATIVQRVRARVSERGREVFDLLLVDGRSVDEVGALMEMTPDAIYAWRSRLARIAREIAAEVLSEKRGC
jgi:RNA polymerase sigma factor (sigma-70 family)